MGVLYSGEESGYKPDTGQAQQDRDTSLSRLTRVYQDIQKNYGLDLPTVDLTNGQVKGDLSAKIAKDRNLKEAIYTVVRSWEVYSANLLVMGAEYKAQYDDIRRKIKDFGEMIGRPPIEKK
jgi:hypothetical protein